MVLDSNVDILHDKLFYRLITESINIKNLVASEGLGSFY